MADRKGRTTIAMLVLASIVAGCTNGASNAFEDSRRGIHIGMTLGEAFDSGLADYLVSAAPKNIAGATMVERRSTSTGCSRHVLEVFYRSGFFVRIYCERNAPSSRMIVPERSFSNRRQLVRALDDYYQPYAGNMEFRVESPPRRSFGVFDHYVMRTGANGRISFISEILRAPGNDG